LSAWQAADGWELRRIDWPQPAETQPRGSLLFASGRGDFFEKYIEAKAHWHQHGWNVTSFDWRGQGGSQGPTVPNVRGHLASFDPLVSDLAGLISHWVAATPAPHVAVAHSMGGHLLLRVLAEHHPPLRAAVLVAPMIGINASPIPMWLGRRIARLAVAVGLRERRAWKHNERPALPGSPRQAYLTSCPERYADELWWRERQPDYSLGPPTWGWVDAAYRSIAGLTPELLRTVRTPALILGTERDRLVSPNAIRRAAPIIPGAELHMFRDAAHEILRESDPVRMEALSRTDAFLDQHAPR
jgi:lysophospholipase